MKKSMFGRGWLGIEQGATRGGGREAEKKKRNVNIM